jgi:hypothetical protein
VAAVTASGWLLRRIAGPVVLVAGPLVVGSTLVVVSSVVVGSTVVVGAVVLGSTVVVVLGSTVVVVLGCTVVVGVVIVGVVMVGCVVVAPKVESAWLVVVLPPTVAGAPAVAGRAVVGGLPVASGALSGVVIGGAGEVVGSPGAVVVNACVGAGLAGRVGSAPPGACCGGVGWWGARLAEATTAARTAVVSPKANSSIRQGRGLARCRGDGVGMCLVPVRLVLPAAGMPPERARLPAT